MSKRAPARTVKLEDGTVLGLYPCGHYFPPDWTGMAPTSASLWTLHDGRWWRTTDRSMLKAGRNLEACDSWAEVLAFDLVELTPYPTQGGRTP